MNLKARIIMEEYREQKAVFEKIGNTVQEKLLQKINESNIQILGIETRVKEEKSLEGKLLLKGEKYSELADITDILGARIICLFSDQIDVIAKYIEEVFEVDWENSVDKRLMLQADEFGYLSLHYICFLSEQKGFDKELCGKRFEIQIRSGLQHIWAVIDHDIGYKSKFEIPRHLRRSFSRLASLLEIADEEFVALRDNIEEYENTTRERIANNNADDILIDRISLNEYLNHNKKVLEFKQKLIDEFHIEFTRVDAANYVKQLNWFGFKNLGDLQKAFEENSEMALNYMRKIFGFSDFDILSNTSILRTICNVQFYKKDYTLEQIKEFTRLYVSNKKRADKMAENLYKKVLRYKENL